MGSETLPSACYILSDESSIPFYSTSNGYKYKVKSDSARDSEAHASARSNSEERQRQQVQNTADHATWESIEQNPGLERARDTKVRPGRDPRFPGKAIVRTGGRHVPEHTV